MKTRPLALVSFGVVLVAGAGLVLAFSIRDNDGTSTPRTAEGRTSDVAGSQDNAELESPLLYRFQQQLSPDERLSPTAIANLARQISDTLPVLVMSDSSEYEALIESWNGRFRYADPANDAERKAAEQHRALWPTPDNPRRIVFFAPQTATAVRRDNGEPNAHRHAGLAPPGGASGIMSSFVFPAGPDDLVANGAPIAEVTMKATTADGLTYDVAFVMVWWNGGNVWMPFRASISGGPQPRPRFMF